jgi:hypothetical protein
LEEEEFMTRAALVSAGGDPFLTMMIVKLFKKYWYDEVDKMYICFNTEMPRDFVPELFSKLIPDPKISIIYHPYTLGYGEPIRQLVNASREELIMLLEDDGFIYTPGIVDNIFKGIEQDEYDLAGSPRKSCSQEIWDRSKEVYNLNYEGYGDKGPNFWPNFFFCKREDLLETDQNFGSIGFEPGEWCKELSYTFKEKQAGDTFVWTSMQLRAMGLRIREIPQHKASPYEVRDRDERTGNWLEGRKPPYLHAGSLSSGYSWNGFILGRQPVGDEINQMHEIETRVAFWKLCSDIEGFDEFKAMYKDGIEKLILNGKLDEALIRVKYNIYKELMGL